MRFSTLNVKRLQEKSTTAPQGAEFHNAEASAWGSRAATVLVAALLACVPGWSAVPSTRPVKIGVGRVFPISYQEANGKFVGFAIDVLNEAARREGVAIEWLGSDSSKSAEDDLRSGRIDLIPAGMVTPERRRMFYVSEPWWSNEIATVSRRDRPRLTRLGMSPILVNPARPVFRDTSLVPFQGGSEEAIAALCRGDIDGALLTHGELHDLFLDRPEKCRGVPLVSGDTTIVAELSIMSRKSDEQLASRLRSRIDEMALDRTLMQMAVRNPPISTSGVSQFAQRLHDKLNRQLWLLSGGMFVAFVAWFLWDWRLDLIRARRSESKLRILHDDLALKSKALERTSRTMAMALEAGKAGTWEVDVPTGKLIWSDNYHRLLGVAPDVAPSMELFFSLVHPDDREALQKNIEDLFQKRAPEFCSDFRMILPDGTHWFERRGRVICDDDGKPIRVVGITNDITEKKRAEEALAHSRNELEAVIDSLVDGVIIVSPSGEILKVNPAAMAMHGWNGRIPPVSECLDIFELISADGTPIPTDMWPVALALQGQTVRNFEARMRRKQDGTTFIAHYGAVPIRDNAGNIIQVVLSIHDLTETKILRGMLPTCARCKKIRDSRGQWQRLETYITRHSNARFSHSLCPECAQTFLSDLK